MVVKGMKEGMDAMDAYFNDDIDSFIDVLEKRDKRKYSFVEIVENEQ